VALKDAVRTAVEVIVPPSPAELRQRLEAARAALVAAQEADNAAQAALDMSYSADDERQALKAQSDRTQARLDLERAAGRVQAIERQLASAEAAEAEGELAAGRRQLTQLVEARDRQGSDILKSLDALQTAVQAFTATDEAILALPESVRGRDAVPGHNLGAGPLRAHVAAELRQRGVVGQPSSVAGPSLAAWLDLGSKTLGAKSS
jgi:hypothetical protein